MAITTTLLPHQKKALEYVEEHPRSALFMFPGAGKSLIALSYAENLSAKRVLITSDKSNAINTWPDEIFRHTDFNVVVRPSAPTKVTAKVALPLCVCTNYDYLSHRWLEYAKVSWDLWIGDESSQFKDQRTDRFKALQRVVQNVKHRVILNGTPMTERGEDLFGQFRLLDEGESLGRTMTAFRSRYMQPSSDGFGWMLQRSALSRMRDDSKEHSYWQLEAGGIVVPQRKYHVVYTEAHPEALRLDQKLVEEFLLALAPQEELTYAVSVFLKRHQLCGGTVTLEDSTRAHVPCSKVPVLVRLLNQNPYRTVVWHKYIEETEVLKKALKDIGRPVFVFDDAKKTEALSAYAASKKAILLIRTSFARGLNQLAETEVSIFYSNDFSYQVRAQAEGRACRVSSRNPLTHYVDLITQGMVDENVYRLLSHKKDCALTLSTLRGTLLKKEER